MSHRLKTARTALAAAVLLVPLAVVAGAQQGWRDDTHSRNALPDYDRVFAQDIVKRLDIRIAAADWDALVSDMASMAGPFGGAGGGRGGFNIMQNPEAVQACAGLVEGSVCGFGNPPQGGRCTLLPQAAGLSCTALPDVVFGGMPAPGAGGFPVPGTVPGAGGGRGGVPPGGNAGGAAANQRDDVEFLPRTPIYIPATVVFDNVAFRNVGLRLKGNSSLLNSWQSGVEKLPFRLNFDALEDEHPDIRDQTFFGFPNLNLTNNSQDASFLRAKVTNDLFRDAGVPVSRTAFVRVFLDRGPGSHYLGLYTLVEVPDEPMLQSLFGSGSGNLYKPVGTGARWTVFIQESFPKKTNERFEDWTDVQEAIAVLNESRADAAVWRARLEARFSVSGFLRWLAFNTIIGNFDVYGSFSPHNYYVYGSPRHRDRLFWIPWDHDLALSAGGPGGGGAGGFGGAGGAGGGLDLFHTSVNASWPLIRFLLDDPVYRAAYRQYLEELVGTAFDPARVVPRLQAESARIAPYVIGAEGEEAGRTFIETPNDFVQATASLLAYIPARAAAVRQALATAR